MRVIDFDAKFFEYAKEWLKAHPRLTEEQIDNSYNDMMAEWIRLPAPWLDGAAPGDYFDRYESVDELMALLKDYDAAGVNLPEPLYARIVAQGGACALPLRDIVADEAAGEALRTEAMGLLRDMNSDCADDIMLALVTGADAASEPAELAADILKGRGGAAVSALLDAYPGASEYAQGLILDVACECPVDGRLYGYLIERLDDHPEQYALTASLLGKLGDERAIEPLKRIIDTREVGYFDYIELRAAIEALGGDAGEEPCFDGDRDYEALKNL